MKIWRTLAIAGGILAAFSAPSSAQWDGCGFGVGGTFWMGQISPGGPIGIGSQGEKAGATVNCDRKMGAFVAGLEVNYDWYFGDIKDLGAKNELSIMGRLGVLTTSSNLLYATAGWGQTDIGGMKVDAWKIGLGDEFRIPNSPMYLDLRGTYNDYSQSDLGLPTGFKANGLEFGGRLKFKFGPGMFSGNGPLFTNEVDPPAPVDPKMAPSRK